MELTAWLSLAFICCVGAMSPGPSLAVVLRYSLYHSAQHGIVASLSHGLGVGIYASLSLLGLASLIEQFPLVYQGLVYAGAVYLAYMGYKILSSNSSGIKVAKEHDAKSYLAAAKDGFAIAFLNPKLAIFFLALFSQFIDPETLTLQTAVIMCMTVLVIDALWYFFVSVVTASARERFDLTAKQAIIDKLLGCAFLLLAARVVYQTF
ncbi:LysE family translocator [Pseudoalteromonas sp. R3]|uniref:LysE family translocator n=1 Tax=Pseudoalteromonas sp. R3 TaxID=1709477 RepID=UPI0006B586B8|nr:LysE family translocator [Pseudoalteromonas sp. R3]AZZ95662.1 LysE family translocator [Pseudoalteromonas sp. R3]